MSEVRPFEYAGSGKIIFLAGPIKGAEQWQEKAITLIRGLDKSVIIASPRKKGETYSDDYSEEKYLHQVEWETHHLRRAGKEGVILFWLAKEKDHFCTRAYAQTTRFELAEWKVRHERDGTLLVVGIERGFSGGDYIRRRLTEDCAHIPICSTLQETCEKAMELLKQK